MNTKFNQNNEEMEISHMSQMWEDRLSERYRKELENFNETETLIQISGNDFSENEISKQEKFGASNKEKYVLKDVDHLGNEVLIRNCSFHSNKELNESAPLVESDINRRHNDKFDEENDGKSNANDRVSKHVVNQLGKSTKNLNDIKEINDHVVMSNKTNDEEFEKIWCEVNSLLSKTPLKSGWLKKYLTLMLKDVKKELMLVEKEEVSQKLIAKNKTAVENSRIKEMFIEQDAVGEVQLNLEKVKEMETQDEKTSESDKNEKNFCSREENNETASSVVGVVDDIEEVKKNDENRDDHGDSNEEEDHTDEDEDGTIDENQVIPYDKIANLIETIQKAFPEKSFTKPKKRFSPSRTTSECRQHNKKSIHHSNLETPTGNVWSDVSNLVTSTPSGKKLLQKPQNISSRKSEEEVVTLEGPKKSQLNDDQIKGTNKSLQEEASNRKLNVSRKAGPSSLKSFHNEPRITGSKTPSKKRTTDLSSDLKTKRNKPSSEKQKSNEPVIAEKQKVNKLPKIDKVDMITHAETISMAIKVGIGLVKDKRFMFTKGNVKELLTNSELMQAIKEWKQSFKDDDIKLEKRNSFSYYGHLILLCCHKEKLTKKTEVLDFKSAVTCLMKLAESHVCTPYGELNYIKHIIAPIKYLFVNAVKISETTSTKVL